ncbi:hypothetical protein BRADI_1g06821v3 [Brachypodium distachyon]|uniref:ADF-H domain-containing protein n=2 Tax=Brachypodium distachyon TaxID=15368 RepID=A0A0Q3N8A8_BRADI|nr:hypothetical protein BRADI_1g06821v3 [Brachypodium distachyon]
MTPSVGRRVDTAVITRRSRKRRERKKTQTQERNNLFLSIVLIHVCDCVRSKRRRPPPLLCSVPMAFMRTSSNASSGMGVAPNIRETFLELQMKKAFRYVIFKIEEKQKQVIVEKTGATTESYDDFLASLPENDCRYALYDFDFVTGENVQKSKIFFIAWSPATSRIRAKMLYSTSKDRIKHELDGFHYEIQATDPTEVELQVLRDRAH